MPINKKHIALWVEDGERKRERERESGRDVSV